MIKNSPKAQEFPAKDVTGHHKNDAPRSSKAEVAKALLSLAPVNPLVQQWPATNEGLMPVFRRELAFNIQHSSMNTGDWWHLVLDTEAPALYVEHTWEHAHLHAPDQRASGTERFGINDFLTLAQDQPAHPVLLAALKEMFRESDTDRDV
jgi:hypothetical protein